MTFQEEFKEDQNFSPLPATSKLIKIGTEPLRPNEGKKSESNYTKASSRGSTLNRMSSALSKKKRERVVEEAKNNLEDEHNWNVILSPNIWVRWIKLSPPFFTISICIFDY